MSLREISETPEHQVFLCTHSTHFVDLAHYKEIVIISKEDPARGSEVRQCKDELFEGEVVDDQKKCFHIAERINPDRGEMFFARKVVFVEGETEKVVIPFLAEKLNIFDPDVSIIECGSKHNLPLYVTIANAFGIPYVVVHEEDPFPDPVPDDWSADKIRSKRDTFGLNERIAEIVEQPLGTVVVMSPDFERASGVSRSQGERKGKALAALDHFDEQSVDEIPAAVVELVRTSFDSLVADNETTDPVIASDAAPAG